MAGVSWDCILQQLSKIDIPSLLNGDLNNALPDNIDWKMSYYKIMPSYQKLFDVLILSFVFEHVYDVYDTLSSFRENISADGFMVIIIDYKDNRAYDGNLASLFQYLMDGSDISTGYIDKIRHTKVLKIAAESGFVVENCILETTGSRRLRIELLRWTQLGLS